MSLYQDTKDESRVAGTFLRWGLIIAIVGFVLGFAGDYLGLLKFGFFAPRVEAVRYSTFKESQAYNDGMLRDLQDIKREYLKATPEQQIMLKEIAIHRFSVYPSERLTPDLQTFYATLNQ